MLVHDLTSLCLFPCIEVRSDASVVEVNAVNIVILRNLAQECQILGGNLRLIPIIDRGHLGITLRF